VRQQELTRALWWSANSKSQFRILSNSSAVVRSVLRSKPQAHVLQVSGTPLRPTLRALPAATAAAAAVAAAAEGGRSSIPFSTTHSLHLHATCCAANSSGRFGSLPGPQLLHVLRTRWRLRREEPFGLEQRQAAARECGVRGSCREKGCCCCCCCCCCCSLPGGGLPCGCPLLSACAPIRFGTAPCCPLLLALGHQTSDREHAGERKLVPWGRPRWLHGKQLQLAVRKFSNSNMCTPPFMHMHGNTILI